MSANTNPTVYNNLVVGNAGTSHTIYGTGGGGGGTIVAGGGGSISAPNIYSTHTSNTLTWYPEPVTPNKRVLDDPTVMETLIERMLTLIKPGEPVVICVDNDFTAQQIREMTDLFTVKGINATIVPGARAGTDVIPSFEVRPEDKRVDVLARIGELWEQRPDMKLTDLFAWYEGQGMTDDDFVLATETHFKKVTEHAI